ncbi:MAG: hypothetical protein L7F78_03635, partial [Syntrophales bacterium LBB04]|nr:hypothetical protein [Syntrophales bacterium LBB04]
FTLRIAEISIEFLLAGTVPDPTSQGGRTVLPLESGDHFVFRVHLGSMPDLSVDQALFNGSNWALYRSQNRLVLQDSGFDPRALPQERVLMDLVKGEGDIFIREDVSRGDLRSITLGYPLDQLLIILLLSKGKGLLHHGCGIEDRGLGYLFVGNSGQGKSTMAKVWSAQGARVLNDDRVVVRSKRESFWMYGTPWHGDFKEFSTNGLPISKVFFLYPDRENRLIPHEGAKAVSMLLTRSFPPLWDKEGMIFTAGFCHQLVSAVPCYEFHFKKDQSVVDFVRNAA